MTAEIAVLNQEAVALAADSAVSGQSKIFTSANKIFALSKYHPVAIMVYDSAQFLGVPWETIIKTYRADLGDRSFPTLREHAAHFLGFFHQANPLFPPDAQENANLMVFVFFFRALLDYIDETLSDAVAEGQDLAEDDIEVVVAQVIGGAYDAMMAHGPHEAMAEGFLEDVKSKYTDIIDMGIEVFEDLPIGNEVRAQLVNLAAGLVGRAKANPFSPYHSGVVIAGFGHDEYFPGLFEFELETIALNRLKYVQEDVSVISAESPAVVRAFAQREQVATFMEGIDAGSADAMAGYWHEELARTIGQVADRLGMQEAAKQTLLDDMSDANDEAINKFFHWFDEWRNEMSVQPIIRVVSMMPKDELAAMAESLVNLTSFRRKVTEEAETVGGPIDVAVISRGDGLVWIKRKHYFSPELNQQFFANYYRGGGHTMTARDTKNAGTEASTSAHMKVYRSINEIRRAFYPKAGEQRSAASARTKNEIFGRTTTPGG